MAKMIPDIPKNMATDGDRPMSIARRMVRERERMLGMTDEERAWRKKWLEAQVLAPEEPVIPKHYHKEMYNPIRRLYLRPWNKFENMLQPIMGKNLAFFTRHVITKTSFTIVAIYMIYYHMKYHRMDWTRKGGWKMVASRQRMYPDTMDKDALYKLKGNQFHVNGFDKSPI